MDITETMETAEYYATDNRILHVVCFTNNKYIYYSEEEKKC